MIIWGKYEHVRSLGEIEDFCPICRSMQPFRVGELCNKWHVYFVPVLTKGAGAFVNTCASCQAEFYGNSNPIDGVMDSGLGELRPRSAGSLERQDLENAVQAGLLPEAREHLLREPFFALAGAVEIIKKKGSKDTKTTLAAIAMIAAFCVFLAVSIIMLTNPGLVPVWLGSAVIMACIAVGALAAFVVGRGWRRAVDRRIVPLLVRSLQPLEPSLEELQHVLDDVRQRKLAIGRGIDPQQLCSAIMAADERDLKITAESIENSVHFQP
jgi:hypothetical protein